MWLFLYRCYRREYVTCDLEVSRPPLGGMRHESEMLMYIFSGAFILGRFGWCGTLWAGVRKEQCPVLWVFAALQGMFCVAVRGCLGKRNVRSFQDDLLLFDVFLLNLWWFVALLCFSVSFFANRGCGFGLRVFRCEWEVDFVNWGATVYALFYCLIVEIALQPQGYGAKRPSHVTTLGDPLLLPYWDFYSVIFFIFVVY